ncbi:cytoplasmic polyadenylation element-binding protein 3 isoform X2 [Epargyreus clarus]|uniref:cytoplasmic polyadenylation element-binding protein 3 isoform X2 n=1 Tax=Epargyreus clarus TaxID=520877 RepID=UPI003C2CE9FD
MPLLHQDNDRGGGSKENRRSLADFLGLDTSQLTEPATAPKVNHRANEGGGAEGAWRWESPGSPEAAHSPRALVPPACFPPRHPTAFASYSESARPGGWEDGQGIPDLVASLALAMPPAPARAPAQHSLLGCDGLDNTQVELPWSPEQFNASTPREKALALPRRASFCGVSSQGHMGPSGPCGPPGPGGQGGPGGSGGEALRWSGTLPARCAEPSGGFSPKVFLGGLPWDITEHALLNALRHFQPVRVEWPGRAGSAGSGGAGGGGAGAGGGSPRGYAYVTLESERRVRALLAAARRDGHDWYYGITSRNMRTKEVQVIPWAVADSNWVVGGSVRLEPARTVFVGALHGMLSAHALALIMNDLFSGVVYAGIDTDKNKYPIGSGRVTFNNVRSYVRAISAAYVEICTDKFTKRVQVDPYLEDSMCSVCNLQQGPYFCREPVCFRYFCRSCWGWQHATERHKPLMRNAKGTQPPGPALLPGPASGPGSAPPSDHLALYNGLFAGPNGTTPSPPTSATSGASEGEHAGDDAADWLH